MNSSPNEPPLVFRYNTTALMRFCNFGLCCGPIFIFSCFSLVTGHRVTMAWIFFVPMILFTGFMLFVSLNVLYRRVGASVELRNGMLRGINRDGKVRVEGKISEIIELKSLYLNPGRTPMEFLVRFSENDSLRFEAQVEKCTELMHIIEERSGKKFILSPRQ